MTRLAEQCFEAARAAFSIASVWLAGFLRSNGHQTRARFAFARFAFGGVGPALVLVPVLVFVLFASTANAVDSEERFDDPVLEQRYQTLIHEVRCLVCLNQTIADSTVPLAAELRRTVHDLVAEGKNEGEVRDYLVARYGDFVMYKPPVRPDTWLLWGAPFILLGIGAVIFARILKHRSAQPLDEDPSRSLDEDPAA